MPRLDGTGPAGMGSKTGRGFGPCAGGTGWRRGGGRGLGWRRFWGYYPISSPTKKEEAEILEEEVAYLEEELKAGKSRLAELKRQK